MIETINNLNELIHRMNNQIVGQQAAIEHLKKENRELRAEIDNLKYEQLLDGVLPSE